MNKIEIFLNLFWQLTPFNISVTEKIILLLAIVRLKTEPLHYQFSRVTTYEELM